ncbi:MAG: hypothetical protein ACI9GH_000642 [Candidatus Paceibacteria bacterium]|jgi:hypothetical protein
MRGNIPNRLKDYLSRFWKYYQSSPKLQNILENDYLNKNIGDTSMV